MRPELGPQFSRLDESEGEHRNMGVIDPRNIRRKKQTFGSPPIEHCGGNAKWGNQPHGPIGINNRLNESGNLIWSPRVEPVHTRKTSEVKIERAIFLKDDKDVFDSTANELQFLVV